MHRIHAEGLCDEATRDKDWILYTILLLTGQEPISEYERLKKVVESFTINKTKDELLTLSLEHRLLIAPVSTIEDVVESPQFADRGYWDTVDDDAVSPRPVTAPGPFGRYFLALS